MIKDYKNFLYEQKDETRNIGKRVRIRNDSEYRDQAYENGGNGEGYIVDYRIDDEYGGLPYEIIWDGGREDSYARIDFDFIEEDEIVEPTKIKWFNKGKLDESDAVDDFFHEINKYEFGDMDKCPRCNSIRIEIDHDRNEGHCINPHCGWDWIIKNEPVIKWYKHGELK